MMVVVRNLRENWSAVEVVDMAKALRKRKSFNIGKRRIQGCLLACVPKTVCLNTSESSTSSLNLQASAKIVPKFYEISISSLNL